MRYATEAIHRERCYAAGLWRLRLIHLITRSQRRAPTLGQSYTFARRRDYLPSLDINLGRDERRHLHRIWRLEWVESVGGVLYNPDQYGRIQYL